MFPSPEETFPRNLRDPHSALTTKRDLGLLCCLFIQFQGHTIPYQVNFIGNTSYYKEQDIIWLFGNVLSAWCRFWRTQNFCSDTGSTIFEWPNLMMKNGKVKVQFGKVRSLQIKKYKKTNYQFYNGIHLSGVCAIDFKFIVLHLSLCLSLYSFAFVLSWNIYFVPWVKGISAAWRRKSFDKSSSKMCIISFFKKIMVNHHDLFKRIWYFHHWWWLQSKHH